LKYLIFTSGGAQNSTGKLGLPMYEKIDCIMCLPVNFRSSVANQGRENMMEKESQQECIAACV
jgi:hypothetical protein